MFRPVILSDLCNGKLYLHSMPGRHKDFERAKDDIRKYKISKVVCLAPLEEIRIKSPEYFKAIQEKDIQFDLLMFPISDYGIPDHPNRFLKLAKDIGNNLQEGENILIHCGAGIGRTGTLAVLTLIGIGLTAEESQVRVAIAGSFPETNIQKKFVKWVSSEKSLLSLLSSSS
jgi:protein-tyrosine phosphatase